MRRRFLNNINKSISGGVDYCQEYFTIEALEDDLTAMLSRNACEYRIDDGSWKSLSANRKTSRINKGQTLSFRGNLTPKPHFGIGTFTISKKCNIKGNIMSMLYGDDFIGQNDLSGKTYAFYDLFKNCTNIVDAYGLILPTTAVEKYCYEYMFYNCTSLTTAPELPATTLALQCYERMFYGCTSLIKAPKLPATTLATGCYQYMFQGCSNLCYIKMLATDIKVDYCLDGWVNGVASSGTFVKHTNMTSLSTGISGIPNGWTVLNDGEENGPNLITFTIDGTKYQAEEGMTWEEWVNSEYNTRPFYTHTGSSYIYSSPLINDGSTQVSYSVVLLNSTAVKLTNVIIENNIYSVGMKPVKPRSL